MMSHAKAVANEIMAIPDFGDIDTSLFAAEKKYVANFKKAVLMVAGSAAQKLMMELAKEQEVLMNIADMLIDVYTSESILLRAEKYIGIHGEKAGKSQELAFVTVNCVR